MNKDIEYLNKDTEYSNKDEEYLNKYKQYLNKYKEYFNKDEEFFNKDSKYLDKDLITLQIFEPGRGQSSMPPLAMCLLMTYSMKSLYHIIIIIKMQWCHDKIDCNRKSIRNN